MKRFNRFVCQLFSFIFLFIINQNDKKIILAANEKTSHHNEKSSGNKDEPPSLSATEIITKVMKTYEKCITYRDYGFEKTIDIPKDTKKKSVSRENQFSIAFVRPDKLRIEHNYNEIITNKLQSKVLLANGNSIKIISNTEPKLKIEDDLEAAIRNHSIGPAGTATFKVVSLLLPIPRDDPHITVEIDGKSIRTGSWIEMSSELQRMADAELDKKDCFKIHGYFFPGNTEETIWIDKKSLLILKIEVKKEFKTFKSEVILKFNPLFNGEINKSLFDIKNH